MGFPPLADSGSWHTIRIAAGNFSRYQQNSGKPISAVS
jgi:hypothetical protein